MKEPQDARKYQVNNDKIVQGQVTGDNNKVEMHFYGIQDKAPSLTKLQCIWNVPYQHNPFFTGRKELLSHLQKQLRKGQKAALSQPQAVSGLGGIGKTQIAIEYAHKHRQKYQAVLWARAESHEALTSSFVKIAALLELPQKDEKDQTIIVQAVKRWLQENGGWLLILDNTDEPAIVREFLPTKCDGHILITTRAQALGGLAQRIEVDTFTPELGALFLLRRATIIGADGAIEDTLQSDREVAIEISKELGGLPLALDQAGAYIEETGCNLAKYLKLYQVQRAKLLKRRGHNSSDYPASVATTWSLSFERVEQNAVAADLLRLCAFLAPDAIPEEMIIKGTSYLGEHLQGVLEDEGLLDEAIGTLRAYSLIRRDTIEKTLSIHRLVQAVLQDAMPDDEMKLWAERAVLTVSKACPTVEFAMWSQWERYLPHALACINLVERESLMFPEAAHLLNVAGCYLYEHARFAEAEPLYVHALTICIQASGARHPDVATSLNNLAELYKAQGLYTRAEPLYQSALVIREQALGPLHPDTAGSLNNLAGLYRAQCKYDRAEPLYQRALLIDEQALGPLHHNTATSLNNLALLYDAQGQYDKAEPLLVRALAIYEQALGPLHPKTAASLNNLAGLYDAQGRYSEAEPLLVRALKIYEQQLGKEHPSTATSLHCLAYLYQHQKKYELAKPLYNRALSIRLQTLGETHPRTRALRQSYADLLRAMGHDEEAKQLEEGNER